VAERERTAGCCATRALTRPGGWRSRLVLVSRPDLRRGRWSRPSTRRPGGSLRYAPGRRRVPRRLSRSEATSSTIISAAVIPLSGVTPSMIMRAATVSSVKPSSRLTVRSRFISRSQLAWSRRARVGAVRLGGSPCAVWAWRGVRITSRLPVRDRSRFCLSRERRVDLELISLEPPRVARSSSTRMLSRPRRPVTGSGARRGRRPPDARLGLKTRQ
jgi:hypothetical protein